MEYFFLAFIQGLTEFLPVSSSGHLAFFQMLFGFKEPLFCFDIILHLATALAVIIFLRMEIKEIFEEFFLGLIDLSKNKPLKQIWQNYIHLRLIVLITFALIPIFLVGFFLHDLIENLFNSAKILAGSFFITGFVLFMTKFKKSHKELKELNFINTFLIGIAQAIAIIPGISRSGLTISAGLLQGINREKCAKFSFLLAVPTIIGATGYKLKCGWGELNISFIILSISFVIAFLSGYLALIILSKIIKRAKFYYFAYYCFSMAIITIILALSNKM
ncbi:MAG: undecaprenyl-diphosphate phosphatase [Candidatus Omnitrophota bacterium]